MALNKLKCSHCGKEYPSSASFSVGAICIECVGKELHGTVGAASGADGNSKLICDVCGVERASVFINLDKYCRACHTRTLQVKPTG